MNSQDRGVFKPALIVAAVLLPQRLGPASSGNRRRERVAADDGHGPMVDGGPGGRGPLQVLRHRHYDYSKSLQGQGGIVFFRKDAGFEDKIRAVFPASKVADGTRSPVRRAVERNHQTRVQGLHPAGQANISSWCSWRRRLQVAGGCGQPPRVVDLKPERTGSKIEKIATSARCAEQERRAGQHCRSRRAVLELVPGHDDAASEKDFEAVADMLPRPSSSRDDPSRRTSCAFWGCSATPR